MKTIEDLKVEKTFYRREKDFLGNVTRTPYMSKKPLESKGFFIAYPSLNILKS